MFERFSKNARFSTDVRATVKAAYNEARHEGAPSISSEHLLTAVLKSADSLALTVLTGFGVNLPRLRADLLEGPAGVRPGSTGSSGEAAPAVDGPDEGADLAVDPPTDAEALASLGIDLDEVRRQADEAFGSGALARTRAARERDAGFGRHLPFDRTSKKVLELSLREALRMRHSSIGNEHLLLGLLHPDTGKAQTVLTAHGVALGPARVIVEELVRARRAG